PQVASRPSLSTSHFRNRVSKRHKGWVTLRRAHCAALDNQTPMAGLSRAPGARDCQEFEGSHGMAGQVSPLAGKKPDAAMLVDVPRLVTAYFTGKPDPRVPSQR